MNERRSTWTIETSINDGEYTTWIEVKGKQLTQLDQYTIQIDNTSIRAGDPIIRVTQEEDE